MDETQDITTLLLAWEQGDAEALAKLMPLVMAELRRQARRYLRRERHANQWQTTELVNEAYLKLAQQNRVHWQNRNQFFALAATCMRRILLDAAKTQNYGKRGGSAEHLALSDALQLTREKAAEVVALDEALQQLARQDERKSKVVELRYFGGYTVNEVAEILQVSPETIALEWRMARAWLRQALGATALEKATL